MNDIIKRRKFQVLFVFIGRKIYFFIVRLVFAAVMRTGSVIRICNTGRAAIFSFAEYGFKICLAAFK